MNKFWAGVQRAAGDEGLGAGAYLLLHLSVQGPFPVRPASGQVKPGGLGAGSGSGKLRWEYIEASFSCVAPSLLASFFWSAAQKQREGERRWQGKACYLPGDRGIIQLE